MKFEDAFYILTSEEIEGGYVNDPNDPGGETKYGISKKAYPHVDIRNLTVQQAMDIYRRDYWSAAHCDTVSANIRLPLFDCAVNQGCATAVRMLQKLVKVEEDGVFGPATAAKTTVLSNRSVAQFMSLRAQRYAKSNNVGIYGAGWFTRLFLISAINGEAYPPKFTSTH